MYFLGQNSKGETGAVTSISWNPRGEMMQVELLFTDGRREYYQPCELELEQKGRI
jgi:hypothetical protein